MYCCLTGRGWARHQQSPNAARWGGTWRCLARKPHWVVRFESVETIGRMTSNKGEVERHKQVLNRQVAVFKPARRPRSLLQANETWKFYENGNQSRKGFLPRADVCRYSKMNLITGRSEVLDRYFNEHLNCDEASGDGVGFNLGACEHFPVNEERNLEAEEQQSL